MPKLTSANLHEQDIKAIENLVRLMQQKAPSLTVKQYVRMCIVEMTNLMYKKLIEEGNVQNAKVSSTKSDNGAKSEANPGEGGLSQVSDSAAQTNGTDSVDLSGPPVSEIQLTDVQSGVGSMASEGNLSLEYEDDELQAEMDALQLRLNLDDNTVVDKEI